VWVPFSTVLTLNIFEAAFSDADFVLARRRCASKVARPKPASLNAVVNGQKFALGML
jgi:hypothetical protein